MNEFLYYGNSRLGNRADIHIHTRNTDGSATYEEVIEDALKKELHTIAITDHDMFQSSVDAWNYGQQRSINGLTMLLGSEVTTRDGHVLAIGIERDVPSKQPVEETLKSIHEQGGIAIAAHPGLPLAGSLSFEVLQRVLDHPDPNVQFDGIEIYNANAASVRRVPFGNVVFGDSNNRARMYYEKQLSHPKKGAAIGGSDAHGREVGLGLTVFDGDCLLSAIKNQETSVMYRDSVSNPTRDLMIQAYNAHVRSRLRQSSV